MRLLTKRTLTVFAALSFWMHSNSALAMVVCTGDTVKIQARVVPNNNLCGLWASDLYGRDLGGYFAYNHRTSSYAYPVSSRTACSMNLPANIGQDAMLGRQFTTSFTCWERQTNAISKSEKLFCRVGVRKDFTGDCMVQVGPTR